MRTTQSLTEVVAEWVANTDVLPTTKADYKRKIGLWFRWLSKQGIDPRQPTHRHVLDYKQDLQRQGKSRFTVASYITIVKLFYGFCNGARYYEPIGQGVKSSFKQKEHYKHPLTRAEVSRLLDSIGTEGIVGKRDKLLVALMITNGLRTCEVARINIQDFDKQGRQTIIRVQRKGSLYKHDTVAVPEIIEELFVDYTSCRDFDPGDPLFVNHSPGHKSERLARTTISAIIKARLRAIGIDRPEISAHSLRHTCGSLLVESGVDVETIRDVLGHTETATTRIYINMAQQRRLLEDSPSKLIAGMIAKGTKKKSRKG